MKRSRGAKPLKSRPRRPPLRTTGRRKAPVTKRKQRRFSHRHRAKAPAVITYHEDRRITFVLPRRLKTPNKTGGFWASHGERLAWERMLQGAEIKGRVFLPTWRQKMRVLRLTPSKRWLLDKDNLDFSCKRLQDAMKELKFIMDDNAKWLDGPHVTQGIASDKCYWAIVTLEPVEDSAPEVPIYDVTQFTD